MSREAAQSAAVFHMLRAHQHNVQKARRVREGGNVFHVLCCLVTAPAPLFVIHEGSWVKRPSYDAHFFSSPLPQPLTLSVQLPDSQCSSLFFWL